MKVKQQVSASKDRRGRKEALELACSVQRIVAARGKKVVIFDMKNDPPDEETLLHHLLGPTGNLRAPTMRRGKTLFVGFQEDEFAELLKGA